MSCFLGKRTRSRSLCRKAKNEGTTRLFRMVPAVLGLAAVFGLVFMCRGRACLLFAHLHVVSVDGELEYHTFLAAFHTRFLVAGTCQPSNGCRIIARMWAASTLCYPPALHPCATLTWLGTCAPSPKGFLYLPHRRNATHPDGESISTLRAKSSTIMHAQRNGGCAKVPVVSGSPVDPDNPPCLHRPSHPDRSPCPDHLCARHVAQGRGAARPLTIWGSEPLHRWQWAGSAPSAPLPRTPWRRTERKPSTCVKGLEIRSKWVRAVLSPGKPPVCPMCNLQCRRWADRPS